MLRTENADNEMLSAIFRHILTHEVRSLSCEKRVHF